MEHGDHGIAPAAADTTARGERPEGAGLREPHGRLVAEASSSLENRRLRNNTYVSARYGFLYVAVAKAACTSMKHLLAELLGEAGIEQAAAESWETDPDLLVHERRAWRTPSLSDLPEEQRREVLEGDRYFRFTVVRNPYTRIFSAWQTKLLLREPLHAGAYRNASFMQRKVESRSDLAGAFQDFLQYVHENEWPEIQNAHWAQQTRLIMPGRIKYSRIGKVEELPDLIGAFGEHVAGFGGVLPAMKQFNESLIPWDPSLVSSGSVDLIRTMYKDDFETFGYSDEPPAARTGIDDRQLRVACTAVRLIRARHERFTCVRSRLRDAQLMYASLIKVMMGESTGFRRRVNAMLIRLTGFRLVRNTLLEKYARRSADSGSGG